MGHSYATWCAIGCVISAGCGRIAFDAADASPDALPTFGSFGTPAALAALNTPGVEVAPAISSDDRELFFASDRVTSVHLFVAGRADSSQSFVTASMVGIAAASGYESEPSISSDGTVMYFWDSTRTEVCTRVAPGAAWSAPVPIAEVDGFKGADLGAADLRLAMHSLADFDLYESTRNDRTAPWSPPRRIVELSSTSDDTYPSLRSDGLEIFFKSTREGTERIYHAQRPALDQPWEPPTVIILGPMLDAAQSEDAEVSADGTTLYFTNDAAGSFNLYMIQRPRN